MPGHGPSAHTTLRGYLNLNLPGPHGSRMSWLAPASSRSLRMLVELDSRWADAGPPKIVGSKKSEIMIKWFRSDCPWYRSSHLHKHDIDPVDQSGTSRAATES